MYSAYVLVSAALADIGPQRTALRVPLTRTVMVVGVAGAWAQHLLSDSVIFKITKKEDRSSRALTAIARVSGLQSPSSSTTWRAPSARSNEEHRIECRAKRDEMIAAGPRSPASQYFPVRSLAPRPRNRDLDSRDWLKTEFLVQRHRHGFPVVKSACRSGAQMCTSSAQLCPIFESRNLLVPLPLNNLESQ